MDKYQVIKGNTPILISAPHVFPHYRPGFESIPKVKELFTREFAIELASQLDCFCIISTTTQKLDPSWYAESPYRLEVSDLIKNEGIKLFIDIHGKTFQNGKELEVWVNREDEVGLNLAQELVVLLQDYNVQTMRFIQNKQITLSEAVFGKSKILSLQLELSMDLRKNLDRKLIGSIKKLLVSIGN